LAHAADGSAVTDPTTQSHVPPSVPARDALAGALRAWFRAHGRPLPWRDTRDPYRVLVSEVMLQQTQVSRVVPAWHAFLGRFPTLGDLASAPTAAVVEQWRGLGYNRRAVNLQRTARAVVDHHGGALPATLPALEALPGVGPYTARAILVFAHEQPVAAVDVNVARVVQRAVTGERVAPRRRQQTADDLVAGDPWVTAQALIELGAQHCAARVPTCGTCPIVPSCAWRARSNRAPDPGRTAPRGAAVPFTRTDRYHRGRLLDALRAGPVAGDEVVIVARTDDPDRAQRLAEALVRDGLATWAEGTLTLPERDAKG
jgi:A/G-specific adenine glycosylase